MNNEAAQREVRTVDLNRMSLLVFFWGLVIIVLLVVFDYIFNYLNVLEDMGFRRIWNVARENSIPTWFSSMLAHLLGITVLAVAAVQRHSISIFKTVAWVLIGLFFLWIGIDDFAEIHEKLGGVLVRMADDGNNSGLTGVLLQNPSFSWHTFIAPVFALFGVAILLFLWVEFYRLRLLHYVILGFGCWFVAQGLDFIEGLDNADELYRWFQDTLDMVDGYGISHTFKVIEETLEMVGTLLLLTGFMQYLAYVSNGLQFRLQSRVAQVGSE